MAKATRKRRQTGIKPTDKELDARIALVKDLLGRAAHKHEIKAALAKKFDAVCARTVENYLARARQELRDEIGRDKQALRSDAFAVYQQVIHDPHAKPADRISAQTRIDKLLGLEAPQRISVSNEDLDREIQRELELAAVARRGEAPLLGAVEESADAGGPGGPGEPTAADPGLPVPADGPAS